MKIKLMRGERGVAQLECCLACSLLCFGLLTAVVSMRYSCGSALFEAAHVMDVGSRGTGRVMDEFQANNGGPNISNGTPAGPSMTARGRFPR